MKKLLFSFIMLVSLITLGSCVVQSSTTIKFVNLPEAVYVAGETTEEQFKSNVTVEIDGIERTLQEAESLNALVTGLELQEAGQYTLVVTYKSFSVTFKYEVVQKAVEVGTEDKLIEAIENKASIIKINKDLTFNETIVINYPVSIYGNGHTLTFDIVKTGYRGIRITGVNWAKVSIYDMTITCSTSELEYSRTLQIDSSTGVEVILDNVSLLNDTHYPLNVPTSASKIKVVIKNGSSAGGYCAINWHASDSELYVLDSELNGNNIHSYGESNGFTTVAISGVRNKVSFENTSLNASTNANYQSILRFTNNDNFVELRNCTFKQAVLNEQILPIFDDCNKLYKNTVILNGEEQK